MATCRGCGREIIWVKSAKGKSIPCDPDLITFCPDKEGDQVYITEDGHYMRAYGALCTLATVKRSKT